MTTEITSPRTGDGPDLRRRAAGQGEEADPRGRLPAPEGITDIRVEDRHGAAIGARAIARWRHVTWAVILIADVGLLAWAAMAALAPERLVGPSSTPILTAGYQGFTGYSWQELVATAPNAAEYTTLLFRMFGLYGVAFSLLAIGIAANGFRRGERWAWWALLVGNTITFVGAMAYDQIVRAVGPFELSEYLGLAAIYGSLAVTAPFRAPERAGTGRPA